MNLYDAFAFAGDALAVVVSYPFEEARDDELCILGVPVGEEVCVELVVVLAEVLEPFPLVVRKPRPFEEIDHGNELLPLAQRVKLDLSIPTRSAISVFCTSPAIDLTYFHHLVSPTPPA